MRMRQLLKKKQEALADYFDFKIYVAFVFKDPKKGSALFEASDVVPIMANNYENKIMKVGEKLGHEWHECNIHVYFEYSYESENSNFLPEILFFFCDGDPQGNSDLHTDQSPSQRR